MASGSDSSRETRPRDVPAPVAAWITRNRREGLGEAERFSINLVGDKLKSHTTEVRELMENVIGGKLAAQAEVQSQQGRDRLAALESVLTQAWQKDIVPMIDETLSPLREEVHRSTEEVTDLRQRNSVLETSRTRPIPARPDASTPTQPRTSSELPALPPLDKNSLFANVTPSDLKAAGIRLPLPGSHPVVNTLTTTMDATAPTEAPPHPGIIDEPGDIPSDSGAQRRSKSKSPRQRKDKSKFPRCKPGQGSRPEPEGPSYPSGSSSPSSSGTESDSDSQAESLSAPQPTFGPKAKKITVWKPTNHRFRGACNYRAYRLVNTDPTVDARVYATTRKRVQYLLVVMGEYKFSGADPIKVISFLARCMENFDNAEMSEAMALMALPHPLTPPAKEAYESQRGYFRRSQGIASWPSAVNWLLRTYATNIQIEQALSVVRDLRQKPGEVENEYATRMLAALARCGDIQSPYERTTLFIEGLLLEALL